MTKLDPMLTERMRLAGLDPKAFGDPGEAWRCLHNRFGRRITLIDRYALEAAHRGVHADQLDADLRNVLRAETLRAQFPDMAFTAGPWLPLTLLVVAAVIAWARRSSNSILVDILRR